MVKNMNKTNNKIIDVQEVVFNQLKRLNDDKVMEERGAEEIARSNVISNNAQTYIKALNIQLNIIQYAHKTDTKVKYMYQQLGLTDEIEDEE